MGDEAALLNAESSNAGTWCIRLSVFDFFYLCFMQYTYSAKVLLDLYQITSFLGSYLCYIYCLRF